MYCRRCGKKLEDGATSCPACGTEVVEVKQRPYADKYRAQRQAEKAQRASERQAAAEARAASADSEAQYAKQAGVKDDPYVTPALCLGVASLVCSAFPWPAAWGVGTSMWMRILILLLALGGMVLCLLATRVEADNVRAADAWNRGHKKRAFTYRRPAALMVARICCGISALMALLSFFTV